MTKLALISLLLFGACKWTEFDDLETEAWVHSTTKPDSNSADWGIALLPGGSVTDPSAGDRLIVLGTSQALFSELNYTPDGGADLAPGEIKLNNQFGLAAFDQQPIAVSDPLTHEYSVAMNSGGGSVAIVSGVHAANQRQIFNPKSTSPDSAAYIARSGAGNQLLVATADTVYGSPTMNPPADQAACQLVDTDGTTPVQVRLIAGIASTGANANVVVWSQSGKLYLYPAGVFDANATDCPGFVSNPPKAGVAKPVTGFTPVDTGFLAAKGSQIWVLDDRFVILAGHHDLPDLQSSVMMYDMKANGGLTPTLVGAAITRMGQRSSTIFTLDATHRFIALGFPNESVNGTPNSGQVALFPINANGFDQTVAEQLSDAQPDSNEVFGRALTSFVFNGHPILAVGADNEVFAYYRTSLYDDTRAQ